MSKLNINRDQPQPSDDAVLKRMDFEKVLQDAGVVGVVETTDVVEETTGSHSSTNTVLGASKMKMMLWVLFGIITLGLCIEAFYYFNSDSKEELAQTEVVENSTEVITEDVQENISTNEEKLEETSIPVVDVSSTPESEVASDINEKEEIETTEKEQPSFEPQLATGTVFNFEESFDMQVQYQKFEEFAVFDNLKFQPIGDFEPSILDVSWDEAILSKKGETYRLELIKKGNSMFCEVLPVVSK